MKLLAVGDSFTWGDDLDDRNNAWPCLLGDKLGYEVTNLGLNGASNSYIFRTVVEQIVSSKFDLVVIAWSTHIRMEACDKFGKWSVWPGKDKLWGSDAEYSHRQTLLDYVNLYFDETWLLTNWLTQVVALQGLLKSQNIPYIMCKAFDPFIDVPIEFIKQIDKTHFLGWPFESMMEWTYGCPKGPRGHFLEQGHEIVSDKIYEHIRHLSWIS